MTGERPTETIQKLASAAASRRSWLWRAVLAVGLVALVVLLLRYVDLTQLAHPEKIRAMIMPFGIWGPVVYSVLKIILMLVIFPLSPVSIAAGLLFGFGWGTAINFVTNLIGSALAFAIARRLGSERIRAKLTGRLATFDQAMGDSGFYYLFVMRLTPVFPFNIVSYVVAVTRMTWRDYLLATTVGMLPTMLIYSYVGAAAGEASLGKLGAALTLLAAISVLPKLRRRRQAEADPS